MGRHSLRPAGNERRERALTKVFAVVALAVVALAVVALLMRPFHAGPAGTLGGGLAGFVIGDEPGLPSSTRYVGVVVEDADALPAVLRRNGLPLEGAVPTGDGTFVLSVGERDPQAAVRDLDRDPDVLDAGHVYERPPAESASP
ncbi:MAG: hypothetical protein IBX62_04895 [Coriobacteriia bacterium]|nr:hypothetical protein [Coriobacteriia bacterium]